MITILYPYRNRELERIKRSLDSLVLQTDQRFQVLFVDYGSALQQAVLVEELVANYSFVKYSYVFTSLQPWSRAKALNVGVQQLTTDFVFTADVDMIFSPYLISTLQKLKDPVKAIYFKVGFLSQEETLLTKSYDAYKMAFASGVGAQGLSLFAVETLKRLHGYDEFLHFWGAEDIDIHNRLERIENTSFFYEETILMLHQWHRSYRNSETKLLTTELQMTAIVSLNHEHLKANDTGLKTIVNPTNWGAFMTKNDFDALEENPVSITVLNKKVTVIHFLYVILPSFKKGIFKVRFTEDPFAKTTKYKLKRLLGKKVPEYYTLKEINDQLLLHIISFYHQYPYTYQVSADLKSITFAIKK